MLNERLQSIVNRVDHLGSVSVNDLAEQFGVSVETVRRDLRALKKGGYLKRSHGGAVSIAESDIGLAFGHRKHESTDKKEVIAEKAVQLIKPGDVIMLDASSSSWYLAKALPDQSLTVVTNSVLIAFELASRKAIKTLTIGGEYSEKYGAFLGSLATAQIAEYRADTVFFSCTGYQEDSGAWESNEMNTAIKRMMLKQSKHSVLLCDSTKMNRLGQFRLCETNQLSHFITEQ